MFHLSTARLVRIALGGRHSNQGWNALQAVHMRGTAQTASIAKALFRSSSSRKRGLALEIVAQLFVPASASQQRYEPYATADTQALLLGGLDDPHRDVVMSAVSGLGHRPDPEALPKLIALAIHRSSLMRWHVAIALASYADAAAVEALKRLAVDSDADVRDWASFGLGTQSDADSEDLRELFWKNAHDPDPDVSGEAVVALARRGDPRSIALLQARLDEDCRVYELEGAIELKSPDLLPALESLRDAAIGERDLAPYWYARLLAAIDACSPAPIAEA